MTHIHRRTLLALAGLLPLASLLPPPARAQMGVLLNMPEGEDFQRIAGEIFQPLARQNDIEGLVVGITHEGRHSIFSLGNTARKDGKPVDGDTLFELGSVSKTFTVTLAALAEQRGLLNLDTPVGSVLTPLRGTPAGRLSLIDLATHMTGGMPLQLPSGITTDEQFIEWLAAWKPGQPPEKTRSYSNVSIGLLGLITARAMGESYTKAVQEDLFPLLSLKNSFIDVPADAMARYAMGYTKDNKPARAGTGLLSREAWGVKSSAQDMLRFLDAQLGAAEIAPELERALVRTRTGYAETAHYTQNMVWEQYPWPVTLDELLAGNSLDMALKPQPAEPLPMPLPPQTNVFINKTGSTNGFGAYAVMLPAQKLGIVILANRNYPNAERVKAAYALVTKLMGVPQ